MNKEDIEKIMKDFDTEIDNFGYETFEVALLLYMRADRYVLADMSKKDIEKIHELSNESETLMSDDLKDSIDDIIEKYY